MYTEELLKEMTAVIAKTFTWTLMPQLSMLLIFHSDLKGLAMSPRVLPPEDKIRHTFIAMIKLQLLRLP